MNEILPFKQFKYLSFGNTVIAGISRYLQMQCICTMHFSVYYWSFEEFHYYLLITGIT